MMRLIDNPLAKESRQDPPEPAFFSGNIASLGQALGRIESQSIVVHDTGVSTTDHLTSDSSVHGTVATATYNRSTHASIGSGIVNQYHDLHLLGPVGTLTC